MPFRGPTCYPGITATDTPPVNVTDITETLPAVLTAPSVSGNTSAPLIFQIFPTAGSTTLGTASAASTSLANNKGWRIPPTTGMAVTGSDARILLAGSILTVRARVVATGLAGNDTFSFRAYKRSSAGVLTSIGLASNTAANGSTGTTTNLAAALTFAADQVFATGETLYVELYITVVNQSITAGTAVVSLNQAVAWALNPPNGVGYRYARASSDSAPATDTVTRTVTFPRTSSDSAPAADVVTRQLSAARSVSDSAPATDSATRVATFPRASSDSAPATDVVTRKAIYPRTVTDSAPAVDVVTRRLTAGRNSADSAPAVDVAARTLIYVRSVIETLGSGGGGGTGPVTPAEISAIATAAATAVWDELTATARSAGSYGALVRTDLDATISSRATQVSVTNLGSPAQASALAALVTAVGTPAQASALQALVTAVGTPAQASALAALVTAVGTPAQASALQTFVTAVGSPAQAAALATAFTLLLQEIDATAATTQALVAASSGGGGTTTVGGVIS